jgi:6-aminohexanoate-oligomer endohydrolase
MGSVPVSNDHLELVPRTSFDGPALRFELPGLLVGVAEYDEGPTGCTVFQFVPSGASCTTDVRGGSPGQLGGFEWVHAICLAGGSLYGLEAATGVAAELLAQRDHEVGWTNIPNVSGAIVYDFGRRETTVYPDKALGRAALAAAQEGVFPLGARGAGRAVTVGKTFGLERGEPSGQGGAFRQVGETKVAVFTVVNAVGAIVDRDGRIVRGHLEPATGERTPLLAGVEERLLEIAPGNTTLTLVVTNQALERRALQQLGRQVHASLSRALQPFQTLADGDILYAVSTAEVEDGLDPVTLAVIASEVAWDAVLASVPERN